MGRMEKYISKQIFFSQQLIFPIPAIEVGDICQALTLGKLKADACANEDASRQGIELNK